MVRRRAVASGVPVPVLHRVRRPGFVEGVEGVPEVPLADHVGRPAVVHDDSEDVGGEPVPGEPSAGGEAATLPAGECPVGVVLASIEPGERGTHPTAVRADEERLADRSGREGESPGVEVEMAVVVVVGLGLGDGGERRPDVEEVVAERGEGGGEQRHDE